MENACILAIDQGTSSTKTIVFNAQGQVLAKGSVPLKTHYLEGGFVEQEPEAIYQNVLDSVRECLRAFAAAGHNSYNIKTCGISNQRETFVVWDEDGKPLHNAIVWQCKRSIAICNRLIQNGLNDEVKKETGLMIDPYFSGTKLIWLYENNGSVRKAIDDGRAYFGTIDTWLLYKMTGGKKYLTDHTNASRTLFFNLHNLQWDHSLLSKFGLSKLNLPEIKPSSAEFGLTDFDGILSEPIAINAMIGDSQSAAFGAGCFIPGSAKATLGTGCSILMNVGQTVPNESQGMINTICWSTENRVDYALEGVIISCGSIIEWLRTELELFKHNKQTADIAASVNDNNGVYLVPAFSGLGAPHWDMNRKAEFYGLTFSSNKNHLIRAALEAVCYQIKAVTDSMENISGLKLEAIMVNGGMINNSFILEFLTNLLDKPLSYGIKDASALGAACLAGLKANIFSDIDQLNDILKIRSTLIPDKTQSKILDYYKEWLNYI